MKLSTVLATTSLLLVLLFHNQVGETTASSSSLLRRANNKEDPKITTSSNRRRILNSSLQQRSGGVVPNDNCRDAIEVTVNAPSQVGTTLEATPDRMISACGYMTEDVSTPSVWYQVRGTGRPLHVSVCAVGSNNDNIQVSVFTGTCEEEDGGEGTTTTPSLLECITGNSGSCNENEPIVWRSEANVVYYILIHQGAMGMGIDTFHIAIHDVSDGSVPENDSCATSVPVSNRLMVPTRGNTTYSTELYSAPSSCSSDDSSLSPALWYRTVGLGEPLSASTCGPYTDFPTHVEVFTGSCPDAFVCIAASNENTNAAAMTTTTTRCRYSKSVVTWETKLNTIYYIRVSGSEPSSSRGVFDLSVESR